MWAYHRGVGLDFSRPGKPTDNSYVEKFNGSLRDEIQADQTEETGQVMPIFPVALSPTPVSRAAAGRSSGISLAEGARCATNVIQQFQAPRPRIEIVDIGLERAESTRRHGATRR